jgi:integrase
MDAHDEGDRTRTGRQPWDKGKLIGQKPPLRPKHVWSIPRDLAMFYVAIDSKLRGCDVVALRVEDVAGTRSIARPFGRRRRVSRSGSSLPNRPGKRWTSHRPFMKKTR